MPAINQYPQLKADDGASNVKFTQAGVSATPRSVQDKLREFISVKDFGAVGNNSTDDTASFQAAINACQLSQTRLHIPEGTYVLSAKITATSTFDISCDVTAALRWTNSTNCGIYFDFNDSSDTLCSIHLPQLFGSAVTASFTLPGYSAAEGWNYDLSSRFGSAVHLRGGNRIKLRVHYAKGWNDALLVEPTTTTTIDNIECSIGVADFCVHGLRITNTGPGSLGISQFAFYANTIWAKFPLHFDTTFGSIVSSRFVIDGVYVNENGGCVVYGVGTTFSGNHININWAEAGRRSDSVPSTTVNLQCPFLGGNQSSNGVFFDGMGTSPNIGYWGGKHNRIEIGAYTDPLTPDLGSSSAIPTAGGTIRIRDAGIWNKISVLNVCDDTSAIGAPIATTAVQGEANYNGGVGGAQFARAVYCSTLLSGLAAGASVDHYVYHQLLSSARARPIMVTMRDESALNNDIVIEAYPVTTVNRETRVRFKNRGSGSFTGSVFFWLIIGN